VSVNVNVIVDLDGDAPRATRSTAGRIRARGAWRVTERDHVHDHVHVHDLGGERTS
jgi:hypothetical protein